MHTHESMASAVGAVQRQHPPGGHGGSGDEQQQQQQLSHADSLIAAGLNPIALYSQSLAEKQLHLARADSSAGVVWTVADGSGAGSAEGSQSALGVVDSGDRPLRTSRSRESLRERIKGKLRITGRADQQNHDFSPAAAAAAAIPPARYNGSESERIQGLQLDLAWADAQEEVQAALGSSGVTSSAVQWQAQYPNAVDHHGEQHHRHRDAPPYTPLELSSVGGDGDDDLGNWTGQQQRKVPVQRPTTESTSSSEAATAAVRAGPIINGHSSSSALFSSDETGTPDLTQSESRPSLSVSSSNDTTSPPPTSHTAAANGVAINNSARLANHAPGHSETDSPDHAGPAGTAETAVNGLSDRSSASSLPSALSSTSSGQPPLLPPARAAARSGQQIPAPLKLVEAGQGGNGASVALIPATPSPTLPSSPTSRSIQQQLSTPASTSPRFRNTFHAQLSPEESLNVVGSTRKSPPTHSRSLSFQNYSANGSLAGSGGFPVRRSSLMPPSSPTGLSSSLPESSTSGLRKRGSMSPQPRRTLSFKGAQPSHPLQQEVFCDEPASIGDDSKAGQPQAYVEEDLEDTIARQAEQIRKERQSKRLENERQQAKAALLQGKRESFLRIDTSAADQDKRDRELREAKGKEREREDVASQQLHPQDQSDSVRDLQGAPNLSPTSPTGQLWMGPVAGEAALVRSPVEGHFPSPTEARPAAAGPGPPNGVVPEHKTSESVLVGNLIGEDHVNYVLMYNMLTGIRIGVSRCEAKMQRPLTDDDYKAAHKFSFDIVGNELTPSARYDFKFKDYAPWVFRELRGYFHLDPADYLLSLTAKYILSELGSPGKSGSFFYFSRDYRFIIKTISHTEHKFLRMILRDYHKHVVDNPHTLISRFYGLHRVKLPRGRKIHFVIMNNLFPPHRDVHETYDLKGSSIGREYPEEKAAKNPRATLKDLNWIHRGRELQFGPYKKALFEEQLRRDVSLLQRLKIMDYSLLIGIHDLKRGNSENLRDNLLTVFQPEGGSKLRRRPTLRGDLERQQEASMLRKAVQRSDPKAINRVDGHKLPDKDRSERRYFLFYQDEGGIRATDDFDQNENTIYYLGIIDILTPYNWYKRGEHFIRTFQYDKHRISAVPPEEYGNRFLAFLFSIIRGADKSKRPKME